MNRRESCLWCGDQILSKILKKHFKKCREEHLKKANNKGK